MWSAFDVVGHLIHGERDDWIPRARIILAGNPAAVFDGFDRSAHFAASRGKSLNELLDTFVELRRENLETLDELDLTPEKLRRSARHPELGEVTLAQLLATWAVHDLTHLGQVARTLYVRYGDAVGPWRHPDYFRNLALVTAGP